MAFASISSRADRDSGPLRSDDRLTNPQPTSMPVTRRQVFYVPGYEMKAETGYRKLFMVAFAQLARRFGVKRKIGSLEVDETIPAKRWTVVAEKDGWRTETRYEMLCWDDLVLRDLSRNWFYRLPLL